MARFGYKVETTLFLEVVYLIQYIDFRKSDRKNNIIPSDHFLFGCTHQNKPIPNIPAFSERKNTRW